ncbi:hypothetical protein IQ260_20530 [Leptolyngbya cf. ectocarpi LEGE 11479]|uniref:Uncharacterized protein n=1 Tax=Leptolyngbya cf. ectocarpi LEGE 11479 TaxID=1828722 RepID=A0A929F816_LEPEC|nr:hypothetical protein [Leptolyngbya ectocarpi]MBE9069035.1 hypothetical protein [Leptolyngbya cf. ectocarpi LEGE 11479]
MSTLLYNCISDQTDTDSAKSSSLQFDPSFLGVWDSTNANTTGIRRVELKARNNHLFLHAYGANDNDLNDWGDVEVELFADRVDAHVATKFQAFYDFDFMEIRIHAWVKLGVLVFAIFNRFKDDSGRSNYFDREFFAQQIR